MTRRTRHVITADTAAGSEAKGPSVQGANSTSKLHEKKAMINYTPRMSRNGFLAQAGSRSIQASSPPAQDEAATAA